MPEPHPLTELIPTVADRDHLAMLIAQSGVWEPVILYEGKILEGRVRYLACSDVGVQPQMRDWVLLDEGDDPLDWAVKHHVKTHHVQLDELARIRLAASVLPHYRAKKGATERLLNAAVGLSYRKIRALDWLEQLGKLDKVLSGEQTLLDAGREHGIVGEKRKVALGSGIGKGDKFDEATTPLAGYLRAWGRKGYEFRHLNPAEAKRRLSIVEQLIVHLGQAREDLVRRSQEATLSLPSERKEKP